MPAANVTQVDCQLFCPVCHAEMDMEYLWIPDPASIAKTGSQSDSKPVSRPVSQSGFKSDSLLLGFHCSGCDLHYQGIIRPVPLGIAPSYKLHALRKKIQADKELFDKKRNKRKKRKKNL